MGKFMGALMVAAPHLLECAAAQEKRLTNITAASPTLGLEEVVPGKEELEVILQIEANEIQNIVDRYSGALPVAPGGPVICSRNRFHPGNKVATAACATELEATGVKVQRLPIGTIHDVQNVEGVLERNGLDGIVVLSAHLDSIVVGDNSWVAQRDPAPGADDDATGIAGVITSARAISRLAANFPDWPRREIRFLLFNAEEGTRSGSPAYLFNEITKGARFVAGLHLDMIGHSTKPTPIYELHAGFSWNPDTQSRSLELAGFIRNLAPKVSPGLAVGRIYPSQGSGDRAEGHGDHTTFHDCGIAACLLCEEFYGGPGPADPRADRNPNYHTVQDKAVNPSYAAELARVAAAAVWVLATAREMSFPDSGDDIIPDKPL